MVFYIFIFIFFRINGKKEKKNTWMRTISVTVMVIISKVPFRKLLNISLVRSSFSAFTRHIDNGIWKTPYSWIFYGHGSTYMQTLSWVNIMKQKRAKVPGNYQLFNDLRRFFEEHCINTFQLLLYSSFFSQTNLAFKFNLVLIEWLSPQFM